MRIAIPVLCILLCGCGLRATREEVIDWSLRNKLSLIYRNTSTLGDVLRRQGSYEFHSLVWSTNAGGKWRDHVVISQAAFQAGSARTRWISQIDSLDPTNGIAIIKVAEGDVPAGSSTVNYVYSWREWSLLTNGEFVF